MQAGKLCSAGIVLLDAGAPDTIRGAAELPDVPPPEDCPLLDFGVTGRELRTVGDAYRRQLEVGPAEILTWVRFRDAPAHGYSPRRAPRAVDDALDDRRRDAPARGRERGAGARDALDGDPRGERSPSTTRSTSPSGSSTRTPRSGRAAGSRRAKGGSFARDGRLVASYTVQAMIRAFRTAPEAMGKGYADAM